MSLQDRIESLKAKHAALEDALALEGGRPHPDESRLNDLKRQKLRIKDQISSVMTPH